MTEGFATMMALALVVGAVGLSIVPTVAADHGVCHDDFLIPDSEPGQARTLSGNAVEVGLESISSTENEHELSVELTTLFDELQWKVLYEDLNGDCVEYTEGGCDGPNTIETRSTQTCTLKPPSSGTRDYFVVNENMESDALDYKNWVTEL